MQKVNFKQGELVSPENNHILTQREVDSYNKYSTDINNAKSDTERNILLDNRAQYFKLCGTAE